jgi:hypothetical protein
MDNNRGIDEENEDNEYSDNEAIERFLENPDAVIARGWFRYILKVKSGCIANIAEVEQMLYDTAIDFEYHLQGLNVTDERIEITIGVIVNEPPLDIARRFQDRLGHAGINTELIYVGTVGHTSED